MLLAVASLIPIGWNNAQAQQDGIHCFEEQNADGVTIGINCGASKQECKEFRDVAKDFNEEETGVAKITNCKVV